MRILTIIWLSKKYFNNIQLKFYKQKKYKKVYAFVKGPKCHKRGKELLKYEYRRSFILLKYSSIDGLDIFQNFKYFIFLNQIFKNFTTTSYYQCRFDFFNEVNIFFLSTCVYYTSFTPYCA